MAALNVPATARASFYIYNLPSEVDTLARAIERASRLFGVNRA
jgi:cysteine desulfurase/selenocysteine lyase